ncbi:hypothetical protein WAJ13_23450, partial [Acinetobacter baumannii]
ARHFGEKFDVTLGDGSLHRSRVAHLEPHLPSLLVFASDSDSPQEIEQVTGYLLFVGGKESVRRAVVLDESGLRDETRGGA